VPPAPLVRLGEGSVVRGFALSGPAGQTGLGIETGKAQLAGPLTLSGLAPALSVGGTGSATVVGTMAAPVRLSGNARGAFVGTTASLEMTGEGGESLVVEGTTGGAGVLVDKGGVLTGGLTLKGALVHNNQVSTAENGGGGVDVGEGRQVTISDSYFRQNGVAITFRGQGAFAAVDGNTFIQNTLSVRFVDAAPLYYAFDGVTLRGNNFLNALPASGQGAAVCGVLLEAFNTTLRLGPGNRLPSGAAPSPGACQAVQRASCTDGADVGATGPGGNFALTCLP
jgi:hypothetical protein